MNNYKSLTVTIETGNARLSVHDKCGLPEIQYAFDSLSRSEVHTIEVSMPGSAASDFMLIQLLAYMKKINKKVALSWTDHQPATHLTHLIHKVIE